MFSKLSMLLPFSINTKYGFLAPYTAGYCLRLGVSTNMLDKAVMNVCG